MREVLTVFLGCGIACNGRAGAAPRPRQDRSASIGIAYDAA
jgi:hypothetical protein